MKKIVLLITFVLLICFNGIFAQQEKKADDGKEPIRVGVFIDLTGATSSFGISTKNGIELAVEEINKSGGINGRRIYLIIEDDQGRPETAKYVVKKLIEEDKVHAILGEVASTNSLAAAPVAQEAKIPMISPSSTNLRVTQVGNYIFRACFVDPLQGEAMANFALFELGAKKVAILRDVQSDYSKGMAENFTQIFSKYNGKIISDQGFIQNDTDFKGQLIKIKQLKPDAIYLPGYYNEVGIIIKQARELKINVPILGGDGWDSPELFKLAGNALKNTYITNHFALDNPASLTRNFVNKYTENFEVTPDALAALGYDAAYVLAKALRRAKTTDGAKLRDEIAKTNYYGVTGKISFDEFRNPRKPVILLKLKPETSEFTYYTTVNP